MSSKYNKDNKEELIDYEPDEEEDQDQSNGKDVPSDQNKKGYVGYHSSGFRDFLLKPEILRAVADNGFEHPSEVQHKCIPESIISRDIICQAKSGMGKTAVFVLSVLQQLDKPEDDVQCLVLCHTRELAYQICSEFKRFNKYLPEFRVSVFYGGIPSALNKDMIRNEKPNIVIGTPGRIYDLVQQEALDLSHIKHFIIDECDKVLESPGMRSHVQQIFFKCPSDKQVMMFSATMTDKIKATAKKFLHEPKEVYVDKSENLTLHGLQQYYVKTSEKDKKWRLSNYLNELEFNQVIIFCRTTQRVKEVYDEIQNKIKIPSTFVYSTMQQKERIQKYQDFRDFKARVLVATDLFGRGIDFQKVNIVINYDMPDDSDSYLHRVGRAGRFGTKGLSISFVSDDAPEMYGKSFKREVTDNQIFDDVQKRFDVKIQPLPDKISDIDVKSYMTA